LNPVPRLTLTGSQLITRITYRYECLRAVSGGIIETAGATFLLLIAVRHYDAGPFAKGILASGGSIGLLLTPITVSVVSRLGISATTAASRMTLLGAVCFLVAALTPSLPAFVLMSVAASTATMAAVPLLTQMFQENYPDSERGSRFSKTVMIRIATAAIFSWLAGKFLSSSIDRFPAVLLSFAIALAFSGRWLSCIPGRPLTRKGGTHPFRAFRYVATDRVFRVTLISWMLMGMGNLMMFPLRVEYLANPKYGMAMPAVTIALLTGVIPNISRFFMVSIWGWLFDRMNFFMMRVLLNAGFAIGILSFFTGDSYFWLVTAAVVFGISNAGGDVAWSLWVTKLAPPSRVADYMSVHTFLNGLRSAAGPLIAFYFVTRWPIGLLGWISVGLILAASLMLIPDAIRGMPDRRTAGRIVEEEPPD
jgi:MFS family permease